jgi:hypothetical protein
MAMTGKSLAGRWKAKLSVKFEGIYDDDFMAEMAQCIVDEIVENMEIQTVVNTTGTATAQSGTGRAGGGIGVIK